MNEALKVIIKEKEFLYKSDFPDGWVFAKGDYFKKIHIDKYTCFTKRFEAKTPENISGWKLMVGLRGKNENNLARIYDIVNTKESGKNIYYVFYEFIDGNTLNNLVAQHVYVDLERLTDNLFSGLRSLHNKDYWFPDFIEKNIFCVQRGGFVLIDLDSVQPTSAIPDNDMWADKEYWALVFNFYKEILDKQKITYADVNGTTLNYLIVIFLVLRLKIYQSDKSKEYHELFNELPIYLDRISGSFKEIFNNVYQRQSSPGAEEIIIIKNLIRSEIVTLTDEQIADIIAGKVREPVLKEAEPVETAPGEREQHEREQEEEEAKVSSLEIDIAPADTESVTIAAPPVIESFRSSHYRVKKGQDFRITWQVKNAKVVKILRNGIVINEPGPHKRKLVIAENYDGIDKDIQFGLLATNDAGEVESDPLVVSISNKAVGEKAGNGKLFWIAAAVFLAAVVTIFAISASHPDPRKVLILNFEPKSVFENKTLVISGENFPVDSGDLKVLFDKLEGKLKFNSENLITVLVPEIASQSDNNMVNVALVIKKDTVYAPGKLSVRKKLVAR
jgi:hypothetical protein